jgi:hypothetical protein
MYQSFFHKYSSDGSILSLEDFQRFVAEQGDAPMEADVTTAFMRDFVRDLRRNVEPAYFTPKEVRQMKCVFNENATLSISRVSLFFVVSSPVTSFRIIMNFGILSTTPLIRI